MVSMQDYTKQIAIVTFRKQGLSGIYIILGQQDLARYVFTG